MERNEFSTAHSEFGSSAGDASGPSYQQTGNTADASPTSSSADHGITDRAREFAGNAQEKLADVGSSVRERAGTMKNSLADALSSGADRLRQRGTSSTPSSQLAGATDAGSVAVESEGRTTQVTNKVAGGMDATADWLRQADLAGLKTSIEGQVKEHPGRTLLIAAGLGYLLGKALRK
jgi:ElaB/YqjD/DUF883 family membrane-anchored ribosome-binding protein